MGICELLHRGKRRDFSIRAGYNVMSYVQTSKTKPLLQVSYTYRLVSEGITEDVEDCQYAFKQVNSSRATDVSFYFPI